MGKKFKITEEQYNKCLAEDITLNADVDAAGGDVKKAVDTNQLDIDIEVEYTDKWINYYMGKRKIIYD